MIGLPERLARDMSGYGLTAVRRLFDRRPIQCSLFVTDRCNLDCAYCTEHDNGQPHPATADLKLWIQKIRALGTIRIALVGGEPLTHPDIVELVAYCRELGLATSLTTNGFLLSADLVARLEAAGLQVMQISVDRVTPSPITRKSLRTLLPKIELVRRSKIGLHLTGVVCADTLAESRAVLDTGLALGIPTEIRLVHADADGVERVEPGQRAELEALLVELRARKRGGAPIHTNEAVLDYELARVRGEGLAWRCAAGYKLFFVSAKGEFWECSARRGGRHILDIKPEDLPTYHRVKPCQEGCGIYCAVSTSLLVANPLRFIAREVRARLRLVAQPPTLAREPKPGTGGA